MPTLDDIQAYQAATDTITDLEAHTKAQGFAPFASLETSHGTLRFYAGRSRVRLMCNEKCVLEYPGPVRIEIVEALRKAGAITPDHPYIGRSRTVEFI